MVRLDGATFGIAGVSICDCGAFQGHFQVLFDREHCPIFQSKLSWMQRIMYLQVGRQTAL